MGKRLALCLTWTAAALLAFVSGCALCHRAEQIAEVSPKAHTPIVERPDEMLPPGFDDHNGLSVSEILRAYGELIGADLDVEKGVRQINHPIFLPRNTPEMTRAQAVMFLDNALLGVGVVVTHLDTKHVVFRLKK
jgi:hypothetical protein